MGQSQIFSSFVTGGKAPYSYQWYLNGTAVPGANSRNWTFTPTTVGNYQVYLNTTDALNFKVQSNIVKDITVFSSPNVAIGPVSVNLTVGNTQQFTSTVAGGLAPYAYQWYYSNGTAISGSTASTLVYKANFTGTYSIYLNVNDSLDYEVQSNTAILNIYSHPTVTISPASVNMTVNTLYTFSSTSIGGLGPYTYQWYLNGSEVPGAIGDSWAFNVTTAGTYMIYMRITDNLTAIVQSNTATARVASQLIVKITPTQLKMYVGQSQTFSSSVSGGMAPYACQWYLNDNAVSGASSQNWNFTPTSSGNYTVYLRVTDTLNFKVQSNIATEITVYSQLTVSISPTSVNITVGNPQTFTSNVSGGAQPYTYQWYLNGSIVSSANSSSWTYTPNALGNFAVYLVVRDNNTQSTQSNFATVQVGNDT